MKKLLLLALGCGLALATIACSESDEELAIKACWHKVDCQAPLSSEAVCKALENSNSSEKKDSENTKLSKECFSARRELSECEAYAQCDDLKGGTACLTEAAKVTKVCVSDLLK